MKYSSDEFNKEYHKILGVKEEEYFNIGLHYTMLSNCFYYGVIVYSLSLGLFVTLETLFFINFFFEEYFTLIIAIIVGMGLLVCEIISTITKKRHQVKTSNSFEYCVRNNSSAYHLNLIRNGIVVSGKLYKDTKNKRWVFLLTIRRDPPALSQGKKVAILGVDLGIKTEASLVALLEDEGLKKEQFHFLKEPIFKREKYRLRQ